MSATWKALASSNKQKIEFDDDDDWETDGNFEVSCSPSGRRKKGQKFLAKMLDGLH